MIKSITDFLIIFFIFQQLKSQIDQNGVKPFCDETLHIYPQTLFTGCNDAKISTSITTRSRNVDRSPRQVRPRLYGNIYRKHPRLKVITNPQTHTIQLE